VAKGSTAVTTIIEFSVVGLFALYVLPKVLASISMGNAQTAAAYNPAAAFQAQQARAINTAGTVGSNALANLLKSLTGQQPQSSKPSGGMSMGSGGNLSNTGTGSRGGSPPMPGIDLRGNTTSPAVQAWLDGQNQQIYDAPNLGAPPVDNGLLSNILNFGSGDVPGFSPDLSGYGPAGDPYGDASYGAWITDPGYSYPDLSNYGPSSNPYGDLGSWITDPGGGGGDQEQYFGY
jgi:hypothetical protein